MNSIEFQPEDHTYTLGGQRVPSVTEVLSHEGLSGSDFWKESDRRRGSAVHRVALLIGSRPWRGSTPEEVVDNSPWDPTTTAPVLVPYGYALARFLIESGFTPEGVEVPVGSAKLRLAGTLDTFGMLPSGKRLLVDYKSGIPQDSAVWPQLCLYAALLEETTGIKVDLVAPVHLRADGTYKAYPPQSPGGKALSIGVAAVSLYHWRRKYKQLG